MGLLIKSVPILTGKTANNFICMCDQNLKNRGTIDFSKHCVNAELILIKADLKQNKSKNI